MGALVFRVLIFGSSMSITFDFQIVSDTQVPGISLVMAQNEDAFSYLTEEEDLAYLADGSVPLATDQVGDFISDAEHAHMCCSYVWSMTLCALTGALSFFVL